MYYLWCKFAVAVLLTKDKLYDSKYALEVYDLEKPGEVLGSYDLHNSPFHHPEGRDLAFLHLQDEEKGKLRMYPFRMSFRHDSAANLVLSLIMYY